MNRLLKFLVCGLALVAAAGITSCQSDDEPLMPQQGQDEALTRSTRDVAVYIDFENPAPTIAGPTSYGANLYDGSYKGYEAPIMRNIDATFALNEMNNTKVFSNGGIAISNWNIRSNPENTSNITIPNGGMTADWWYSYNNQCSVYNTASTDGENKEAGYNKSNNFAVVYGYQDSYNTKWMSKPYFTFTTPKNVSSMYICNTSYTYGVIVNGNTWYENGKPSGHAKSLVDQKGWFKVTATGYDSNGKKIKTVEKYLCDYRDSTNPKIPIKTTWEQWYLNLENVSKVEFNFEGSDTGVYGLNTPAYLCIDHICVN